MLTVYSRRNCERCLRIKKELAEKNVPYKEMIIGEDIGRDSVLRMFPEATQVPILSLSGRSVRVEDL